MAYSRPTNVPDSLIRDQILAVYAGLSPGDIRPARPEIMGNLAVSWERVRGMRDRMVEAGKIPDLKPNTGGSMTGKRAANLAISRPIKAVPVLERESPDMPRRKEPAVAPVDAAPGRYRRPRFVRAELAAEKSRREYRDVLLRRIAEREREAMA